MSFTQALEYAKGPGIAVIAGLIISILVEYWPAFQAMPGKSRVLVYIVLCLLVPSAATALGIAVGLAGAWADLGNTWWPAIAAGLTAAGIGTLFHAWAPEPRAAKVNNAPPA